MWRGHPTSLPRASRLSKAGQNSLWSTCFSFRGSVSPGSREPWAERGAEAGRQGQRGPRLPGYRAAGAAGQTLELQADERLAAHCLGPE